MRPIDPELLVTFVAIADLGGFQAAAGKVGRSVSTVSMQMKRLEALFAPQPLFRQEGRRRELTACGQVLLGHARRILALNEILWSSIVQAGPERPVRIGAPDDYAGPLLEPVLADYATVETTPVDVVCAASPALRALIERDQIDLALLPVDGRSDAPILRREPLVWVSQASHEAGANGEPLPLVLQDEGSPVRDTVLNAWATADREFRIAATAGTLEGLLAAVRAGLGVAALPACSAPSHLVRRNEGDWPALPSLAITLARRPDREARQAVDRLATIMASRLAGEPEAPSVRPS
jgi:DNA-binding transcriptional LysR family regulator